MDFFLTIPAKVWTRNDDYSTTDERREESQTDNRAAESFSARRLCVRKQLDDPELQLVT